MTTYKQEIINDYVKTYTGKQFYVNDPKAKDLSIVDVAHSLSRLARFTGHSEKHYTVGEHSLGCMVIARELGYSPLIQLYALLHDGSECIMNDVSRPVKQNLPEYKKMEDKVMDIIWELAELPKPTEEDYRIVKKLDNTMLLLEMKQLMNRDDQLDVEYFEEIEDLDLTEEVHINEIKNVFLMTYEQLKKEYEANE